VTSSGVRATCRRSRLATPAAMSIDITRANPVSGVQIPPLSAYCSQTCVDAESYGPRGAVAWLVPAANRPAIRSTLDPSPAGHCSPERSIAWSSPPVVLRVTWMRPSG
jgi:hypothetical protein